MGGGFSTTYFVAPDPATVEPTLRTGGTTAEEDAARVHLRRLLASESGTVTRGEKAAPAQKTLADLEFVCADRITIDLPDVRGNVAFVRFRQTKNKVHVFGSSAVVELGANLGLRSASVHLAAGIPAISPHPSCDAAKAFRALERAAVVSQPVDCARLNGFDLVYFYHDRGNSWHLAFLFRNVSSAPADQPTTDRNSTYDPSSGGLSISPRDVAPEYDYVVDAHDLKIVAKFSSAPSLSVAYCSGIDEEDALREFYGRYGQPGTVTLAMRPSGVDLAQYGFEMWDELRRIKTYDLGGQDISMATIPSTAVCHQVSVFDQHYAAVSAHVNAQQVFDFFTTVLKRQSIDSKPDSIIESVVNCTYTLAEPAPEWHNAIWWKGRMWYGQCKLAGQDRLRSYSRYLDILAHELTHGMTSSTADLVYEGESGALNESVSDIFAILVKNRVDLAPDVYNNVLQWNWEIGPELGKNGLPLRDLSCPARTASPDHYREFGPVANDAGGVHTFSNVHNKAAHNLLTSRRRDGESAFSPDEVAILYYLALLRLNNRATFRDMLDALANVLDVLYSGAREKLALKRTALAEAYAKVGIISERCIGPSEQ